MSAAVTVRAYTDPGCPLAFAAEGVRLRLLWRYGDQIAWEPRMSVLRHSRGDGWPAEPGSDATLFACLAVVAAGLRWPERRDAFLRRLRVLAMAGGMLDDSDTLEIAAEQAGLPVAEIAAYCAEPEVEAALQGETDDAPPSPTCEIVAGDATARLRGLPAVQTAEVLRWARVPLTAAELAAVCGRDVDAELEREARYEDGYWQVT